MRYDLGRQRLARYINGVPDDGWNNDVLVQELRRVHGSDFEAVDVVADVDTDSGQARRE